jgi:hypothetical protein
MSHASEVIAVTYAIRHCTEYGCAKCAARVRWSRRKKWQSAKSKARRDTGRK